jgi:hypothetical protein
VLSVLLQRVRNGVWLPYDAFLYFGAPVWLPVGIAGGIVQGDFSSVSETTSALVFCVPYICAFAVAMIVMRWNNRKIGRRRLGLCTRCGYDLRATLERCPECGTPVVGQSRA